MSNNLAILLVGSLNPSIGAGEWGIKMSDLRNKKEFLKRHMTKSDIESFKILVHNFTF